MRKFEDIVNLMSSNGPGGSSLEQHCAAMRMDSAFARAFNRLNYALHDARKVTP